MPKIVDKEERRNKILEGLNRCLLEKHFNETSIKEIAKAAGVNHGLLHYYFKNKEDILLSYIDYVASRLSAKVGRFMVELAPGSKIKPENYKKMMINMFNEITFDKELSRTFIEIWSIANYNEAVRKKLQVTYREWKVGLCKQIVDFFSDPAEASDYAMSLVAFFEGMALFSVIYNPREFNIRKVLNSFANRSYGVLENQKVNTPK